MKIVRVNIKSRDIHEHVNKHGDPTQIYILDVR